MDRSALFVQNLIRVGSCVGWGMRTCMCEWEGVGVGRSCLGHSFWCDTHSFEDG